MSKLVSNLCKNFSYIAWHQKPTVLNLDERQYGDPQERVFKLVCLLISRDKYEHTHLRVPIKPRNLDKSRIFSNFDIQAQTSGKMPNALWFLMCGVCSSVLKED